MSARGIIKRPPPHVGCLIIGVEQEQELSVLANINYHENLWPEGVDYAQIAKGKALVCARERMDTLAIAKLEPWRFRKGDCRYPGAVYRNGLVVSFSGVEARNDHTISGMVAEFVMGLATLAYDEVQPSLQGAFLE
ncbi:MAG: hypothetical protein NUV52_03430 [Candidatus Roizmanbacteria bacterium]|nr:hypothetical protein [Candidatus Roizmanbacteria bacterium]